MGRSLFRTATLVAVVALAMGCSESPAEVATTTIVSVNPSAGSAGIATNPVIEVRFTRPISPAAAPLIALQVGDCPGPVVTGSWSLSSDGTTLRFQSMMGRLDPGTRYTIHLAGGMTDAEGTLVEIESNADALGGEWVTAEQVTEMLNMAGMGMGPPVSHSGPGWQHPNGFYGLAFGFTTAGG